MNKNKAKCDFLKSIRKKIADKINIDLHQVECTFQGTCTGTCPKCKQEEDILNKELLKRATAIGLGAVASLSLVACGPIGTNDIQGDMDYIEPEIGEGLSGSVVISEPSDNCETVTEGEIEYTEESEDTHETTLEGDVEYIDENEEEINKIKLQYEDSHIKFETKELMGVIPSFYKR